MSSNAQLQQLANHGNQWVAGGGRFHSNQIKTTFYPPAIMERRVCLQKPKIIIYLTVFVYQLSEATP
jgi:hypothetical protein